MRSLAISTLLLDSAQSRFTAEATSAAPVSPAVVESEAVAGFQPAQVSPVAAIGDFQI